MRDEWEEIVEMSGIALSAQDGIGNDHKITSATISLLIDIVTRTDLLKEERAMMLSGLIHAPLKLGGE
jgi:hypothetical protein